MFPEDYKRQAESLPFTVDALDDFNRRIQTAIEFTEAHKLVGTSQQLSQVKFLANRRFDQWRRECL